MARGRLSLFLAAQLAAAAAFEMGGKSFKHTWQSMEDMPSNRSDMTATTVGDDIYLIGGCSGDQEWNDGAKMYLCSAASKETAKYTPASNTFTPLENAPATRYRHAAAAVDKKIYIFGGVDVMDNVRQTVDVFDTVAGTWSSNVATMPAATTDLMAVTVTVDSETVIMVMGGYSPPSYDASNATQIFYPKNNTWATGPSLVQGRGDAFAAVADGKVYVVGGFHHSDWTAPLKHMEMLDPKLMNGGWTAKREMSLARGDKAAASLHDVLHIIGGETKNGDGHSVPLTDVEVFDAAEDKWYAGGEIPSHRFRFTAAAHGNSIYIFGGQGYLVGTYGTVGSKYPIYKMVEQYEETMETVVQPEQEVSGARGMHAGAAALLGSIALLVLPTAA